MRPTLLRLAWLAPLLALALAACGATTSTLPTATPTVSGTGEPRPASLLLTPPPTPGPVSLPADDAPHDVLTEWWYYTGHLQAPDGRRFGFEFVIFQTRREGFPPGYAAHFAVTDVAGQAFHFDERAQTAGQPAPTRPIDLRVGDWSLQGGGGDDRIHAAMPGYALDLHLRATKPPVLHNRVGYFQYAPGTGSYYYSRTRLAAEGTLATASGALPVSGQA